MARSKGQTAETNGRVAGAATDALPAAAVGVVLGLFQALLGASILVVPHWFGAGVYRHWMALAPITGPALLLAGFALLWAAVLPARGAVATAAFALTAINLGVFAAFLAPGRALQGVVIYGIIAVAAVAGAVANLTRNPRFARATRDPLRPAVHATSLAVGILMLGWPEQYAAPVYDGVRPWLPVIGPVFALLGAVLLVGDLFGPRWRAWTAVGDAVLGLVFLVYAAGYVAGGGWTALMLYALLGLGLLAVGLRPVVPAAWGGVGFGPNQRLVALAVTTALVGSATVLTVALAANAEDTAREHAGADSAALANVVAGQIELYVDTHRQALQAAADTATARAMDRGNAEALVRGVADAFPGFATVSLVSPDRMQLARSDGLAPVSLVGRPSVEQALAGQAVGYGGVTTSVATGEPVVALAVPVRNGDNGGAAIGAVSGIVSLRDFAAYAAAIAEEQGSGGVVHVFDSEGRPVVGPGDGQAVLPDALVGQVAAGALTYSDDDVAYLAGAQTLPDYDWTVVVARPETDVLGGVRAGRDRAFALLVGASALLALGGVLLSRSLFRPVLALLGPIRALGEGRDDVTLPAVRGGEIGDVAIALGRMRGQLRLRAAALRDSEERFRRAFEDAAVGMALVGLDGSWLQVNQALCDLTGYSEGELRERTFQDITHPDDLAPDLAQVERLLAGEIPSYQMEKRYIRKDGGLVWVLLAGTLQRDAAGAPVQFIAQVQDISPRKRAEREVRLLNAALERRVAERTAQLEASNKELEAFAYSVSHDLRAPLRAIDGFSQVLEEDFAPELPDEARHYLGRVRNGAQRMGQLIDDLLAFSRLGRRDLEVREVDPARLVADAWDDLAPALAGRNVDFRVGELPSCQADPALLRQVFANLLGNAVKFTRERDPARIEVSGERAGGDVVFSVRDNGVGFDPAHADKLFGIFQRLHRAEDYEGTGVGLALVQRIVHRHGGRIWAESRPGEGATFRVALPEHTETAAEPALAPPPEEGGA